LNGATGKTDAPGAVHLSPYLRARLRELCGGMARCYMAGANETDDPRTAAFLKEWAETCLAIADAVDDSDIGG
jgi:hypothetical protein